MQVRSLLLASASPRRQELLRQIGVGFQVVNHGLDESILPGEDAAEYALRLASEKAHGVLSRSSADRDPIVLGADTVVVRDRDILGKPANRQDALQMLSSLSGTTHQVISAVAVLDRRRRLTATSITDVAFRDLSKSEIEAYWKTGEPRDKAGAYGIQGYGAVFVSRIVGSYSGVVGLPLFETAGLLQQFGLHCWAFEEAPADGSQ